MDPGVTRLVPDVAHIEEGVRHRTWISAQPITYTEMVGKIRFVSLN